MNFALNESTEMFLPVDKCTHTHDFYIKQKIKGNFATIAILSE